MWTFSISLWKELPFPHKKAMSTLVENKLGVHNISDTLLKNFCSSPQHVSILEKLDPHFLDFFFCFYDGYKPQPFFLNILLTRFTTFPFLLYISNENFFTHAEGNK